MEKIIAKAILAVVLGISTMNVAAQTKNTNDWINDSHENGVYGVAANKAYQYIASKKLKAKAAPIVAIIGTGIDVEHEALKNNIWVNSKEKAGDGKDNDKNGYIDDINGWNFLGGKDGVVMENTMREGDREYLRLRAKYDDIFLDGNGFFRYDNDKVERVYIAKPIDMAEYKYFTEQVRPESEIARSYSGRSYTFMLREYAHKFNNQLKEKYPNREDYTQHEFISCWDKTGPQDTLQNVCMTIIGMYFSIMKTDSWNQAFNQYGTENQLELADKSYVESLKRFGTDGRKEIIGDDFNDINDKHYGNNVLLTANAASGTMAAGIIAGKRNVEGRNNPIAENARIMGINISGESGEPYLKDMALGIRYAVDNGASIIILGQQNTLYNPAGKVWMCEAIRYAESKQVLIIVPTWELSYDLSVTTFFPNRKMTADGKELTNIMVVSASDQNGTPVLASSYSEKELDLYAPGVNMLSSYIGDTYQTGSGTLLSAATTAGVAALVKTYYPELTPIQLRKLLIESCTSRKGEEVEKGIIVKEQNTQDLFLFEQLCISGGIVNAYNALEAATKLVNQ